MANSESDLHTPFRPSWLLAESSHLTMCIYLAQEDGGGGGGEGGGRENSLSPIFFLFLSKVLEIKKTLSVCLSAPVLSVLAGAMQLTQLGNGAWQTSSCKIEGMGKRKEKRLKLEKNFYKGDTIFFIGAHGQCVGSEHTFLRYPIRPPPLPSRQLKLRPYCFTSRNRIASDAGF